MKKFSFINKTKIRKIILRSVGEIVLIVIGASIAICFTNIVQRRNAKKIEVFTLGELKTEIEADFLDVNANLEAYKIILKRDSSFLWSVLTKKDLKEPATALPFSLFKFDLTLHYSAYETFKLNGLNSIVNPELRSEIIRLYDFHYRHMEREENLNLMDPITNINLPDYMTKYFTIEIEENKVHKVWKSSKSIDQIMDDTDFLILLDARIELLQDIVRKYKEFKMEMGKVIDSISIELKTNE